MKLLVIFVCLAVSALANKEKWEEFKANHNKEYRTRIEEVARYEIFTNNLDEIENHNVKFAQGLTTYKKGVNKFADWTKEEFLSYMKLNQAIKKTKSENVFKPTKESPKEIDWRASGAVTDVKDQGSCGSCWAFSTTGSLEGQLQRQKGILTSLSEQNLVDCSCSYGNDGCSGGLMDQGFQYIKENGINSEASYPYEGIDRACRMNTSSIITKVSGFVDIEPNNEKALENAVANIGPISIGFDATFNFQLYESGLFDDEDCSSISLNHGILIVGYGCENGVDYWIVKNSWGPSWGENGYVRVVSGKNMCGVSTDASYPEL